jgi:hypothetical protein
MGNKRRREGTPSSGLSRREYMKLTGGASLAAAVAGCLSWRTNDDNGSGFVRYGYGGAPIAMSSRGMVDSPAPTPDARWKLDETEGSTAADAVGSLDGTIHGSPILGASGIRGTGSFDFGESDSNYVVVPDSETIRPGGEISFGGWYRTESGASSQAIVQKADSLVGDCGYAVDVQTGNSLRAHLGVKSGAARINPWGVATHDGEWHHIMLTWDGDAFVCYLDGEEVARDESQSGSIRHSTNPLYVARGDNGWSATYGMDGAINDVRVYDTALAPSEVREIYDGTADSTDDEGDSTDGGATDDGTTDDGTDDTTDDGTDDTTDENSTDDTTDEDTDETDDEYGKLGYGNGGYGG